MRNVIVTHDENYNPSMDLVGLETIGSDKVVQLEVNNKFICVSMPGINTIKLYSSNDL